MITENAVYSDQVTIHAPVELVWQVLTNFADYEKWNPFCPIIKTELKVGAAVDMMVDLGKGLQKQVETMTLIEAPNVIAWEMVLEDRATLHACRTQTVTERGEAACIYESVDRFHGALTPTVLEYSGAAIEKGFNACAQGLKDYAEALYLAETRTLKS